MSSQIEVDFAGRRFVLDAALGLFWPSQRALVVSDLHLEKSTYLAQFGSPVAPYDTNDTLYRLEKLVSKYAPKSLVLLGDSFHDPRAWERLELPARQRLLSICASVDKYHLVEGNHDFGFSPEAGLKFTNDIELAGIAMRHEPKPSLLPQIIGHFHPKLRTLLRGHRIVGKCFALTPHLLIMPSFGSFTGGLDINDEVFVRLADGNALRTYIAYRNTIAPVKASS